MQIHRYRITNWGTRHKETLATGAADAQKAATPGFPEPAAMPTSTS